jgi:hypothetical protein
MPVVSATQELRTAWTQEFEASLGQPVKKTKPKKEKHFDRCYNMWILEYVTLSETSQAQDNTAWLHLSGAPKYSES